MRVRFVAAAGAALLVGVVSGRLDQSVAAQGACDRACLQGFVDQYLAAMAAHKPETLPLTRTARYTENGQALKLGDGTWGPAIALGGYKVYFADPRAGQVG